MKNRLRVIIIIVGMILVMVTSILMLNPDLKDRIFMGIANGSEGVERRSNHKSEKKTSVDDSKNEISTIVSSSVSSEEEPTEEISRGDYYLQYHKQLKENLESSDLEVREQTLQPLRMAEQLMKNVNPGNKAQCIVCMGQECELGNLQALEYNVINVRLTDNIDEYNIEPNDFISIYRDSSIEGCIKLQKGFQFVEIDLEIKNITGKKILDVPVLGLYYYLIDDEGTEWASEMGYGTLQPGRNPQHKYFLREMADGEVASTTMIATVPTDPEFEVYSHYLYVNPFGYTDYVDGGMALIRLDEFLDKDS